MKKITVVLFFALAVPHTAPGQILNAGFEAWSGTPDLVPDSWTADNISGQAVPITRSSTAHSGSYSVKGTVVSFSGSVSWPPQLSSYSPLTQRAGSLTGYYQYTPVAGDSLNVIVWLFTQSSGGVYAVGSFTTGANVSQWTKFVAPIFYANGANPDSGYIQIFIAGADSDHVGSSFLMDDLAFEGTASSVEERGGVPTSFALEQNYPNPFNPLTSIEYTVGGVRGQGSGVSNVRLGVYDLLGKEVATLVNEVKTPGTYTVHFDASGLPSGVYFYRMVAGEFTSTRRLVLLK